MIAILIPEFPTQTHIFFWREIEAIRATGESVVIVSTRRPAGSECRHAFAAAAALETCYLYPPRWGRSVVTLLKNPAGAFRALRYCVGLKQTPWRQRLGKLGFVLCAADLVDFSRCAGVTHVHSHSCADAAHIVAISRILGGPPFSLTLHGDLSVYGRDHSCKMADATFVATDGPHLVQPIVEEAGFPADRVLPTCMGLDTEKFQDTELRTYEPGRLHLVTVARLHRSKGHHNALAAIRTAVDLGLDIRYTIAGSGPHASDIQLAVDRLRLSDRVTFVGSLGEHEVLELLQRADAFVLPSNTDGGRYLGEAWPISLMEAMACGLPVISSIIGSTLNMVQHGVDGFLVEQGDETALAEAIVSLARDPELRRRLGAAARLRAETSFSVRDTARTLLDAINRFGKREFP